MKTFIIICSVIASGCFTACDSDRDKAQHASTPRIIHGANEDKVYHDVNAMKDPDDRFSPDEYAQKKQSRHEPA